MATRPQRFPAEREIESLLVAYRQAQRTIVAQIKLAVREGDQGLLSRRRHQLARVLVTLDQLGVETDPVARRIVADVFAESAERTARAVAGIGVGPVSEASFAGVSREAVEGLQDAVLSRLADARATIGRQVADVFARAQRRSTMLALLGAEGSPRAASKQLRESLVSNGQTGFIDRAGKRWALDTYSEMAVRTVTREAVVQGAVTRMAAHGVDLARISTHASSCSICKPWEGRLISLDGSTESYQGEAVADGPLPPLHPRCRHTVSPVAVRVEAIERQLQGA